jgi:hypothetical protein
MPSIMIVAKTANGGDAAVFLAERFTTVQLDDPHFARSSSSVSSGRARTPSTPSARLRSP